MKTESAKGGLSSGQGSDDAYEALLERSRETLRASAELSPAAWVRVREGIDEEVSAKPNLHWAWMAAALASATALLFSIQPLNVAPEQPLGERQKQELAGTLTEAHASEGAAASIRAGQALRTTTQAKVFEAFGRHRLTLEPESTLKVLAWSPSDLALHLSQGAVDADIAKARAGERIEIRTDTAEVRVVGTRFRVAVDTEGATQVDVSEGVVQVAPHGLGEGGVAEVSAGASHRVEVMTPKSVKPGKAKAKKTKRRRSPGKSKRDNYRLIEIDVPPQKAPNVR